MTAKSSNDGVTRGEDWFELVLPFPPTPASRPRVTRWGTYYGKTYKAYRELADKAIPLSRQPKLMGNLHCTVEFVCRKPKTTKRANPLGDIDNHTKAVLDAISGTKKNPKGYWGDDMQIVTLVATKRWPEEDEQPHTRIRIEQIDTVIQRMYKMARCLFRKRS